MKTRTLIIEPHADDALFSTFSIMSDTSKVIDVLTCCTHSDGRSSDKLVDYIPTVKSVTTLSMTEDNFLWSSKSFNHHDVNRVAKDPEVCTYTWTQFRTKWDNSEYEEALTQLTQDVVVQLNAGYDEVYIPVGIVHPFHILVAEACQSALSQIDSEVEVYYYAERPYSHKKFTYRIYEDFKKNYTPGYVSELKTYDGSLKGKIIEKVYPGELANFHWDLDKILEFPELILERRLSDEV